LRKPLEEAGTSPTLYYGWRIAWALAVTQTVGYGVLYYAFGVFVTPMEAELGWSRAQTSGAFSVGLLVAGLGAIPAGRWVDRNGARGLMTLGSVAGVLLVLLWSRVTSLGAFYALWVGIGLVMSAVLYEVAFTVVAAWFRRQRARATFAITMVAGLASTVFVPLTTLLVVWLGWREALVVLALLLAVGTVPLHVLVLRRRPSDLGLEPDGLIQQPDLPRTDLEPSIGTREALKGMGFWWLSAAFALSRLSFAAMGAHLVPLLLERGFTPAFVAVAVGAVGPLQLLGRLAFLPSSARWSLHRVTVIMFVCLTLAFLSLLLLPNVVGVCLFVTLYGASNGATTLSRAGLVAERYGPAHYGSLNGVVALVVAVVGAFAPLGAGALYALSDGYEVVLWALVVASLGAVVAVTQTSAAPTEVGEAHA
jgi:MFS family permease